MCFGCHIVRCNVANEASGGAPDAKTKQTTRTVSPLSQWQRLCSTWMLAKKDLIVGDTQVLVRDCVTH